MTVYLRKWISSVFQVISIFRLSFVYPVAVRYIRIEAFPLAVVRVYHLRPLDSHTFITYSAYIPFHSQNETNTNSCRRMRTACENVCNYCCNSFFVSKIVSIREKVK